MVVTFGCTILDVQFRIERVVHKVLAKYDELRTRIVFKNVVLLI